MKEIEIELRKKFIDDLELPIVLPQSPYFENSLNLLEPYTGARTKWESWEEERGDMSPGKFLQTIWDGRDKILDYIRGSEAYHDLEADQELYNRYQVAESYPGREIYNGSLVGHRFISIDMKTANFQALRHYDPAIVRDCSSWSEFCSKFSDSRALVSGKKTRQSILGKLEPKRQATIEKYLMSALHKIIGKGQNLISMKTDELIYEVEPGKNYDKFLGDILWKSKNELDIYVKAEIFTLDSIQLFTHQGNSIFGFIKKYEDRPEISFHGIPKQYILQFIKYYEGREREINDIDLSFSYQDQEIAKFVYPLSYENPS